MNLMNFQQFVNIFQNFHLVSYLLLMNVAIRLHQNKIISVSASCGSSKFSLLSAQGSLQFLISRYTCSRELHLLVLKRDNPE